MISADLAADGPPQMRAKVKCQSSAKHFRGEEDPETAGGRLRDVQKLLRKVSGEVATCAVSGFGLVLPPRPRLASAQQINGRRAEESFKLCNETAETETKQWQQLNLQVRQFYCLFGARARDLDPPESEGTRQRGGWRVGGADIYCCSFGVFWLQVDISNL